MCLKPHTPCVWLQAESTSKVGPKKKFARTGPLSDNLALNLRLLLRVLINGHGNQENAVLPCNTASYCPPIDQSDCNIMTSSHIINILIHVECCMCPNFNFHCSISQITVSPLTVLCLYTENRKLAIHFLSMSLWVFDPSLQSLHSSPPSPT